MNTAPAATDNSTPKQQAAARAGSTGGDFDAVFRSFVGSTFGDGASLTSQTSSALFAPTGISGRQESREAKSRPSGRGETDGARDEQKTAEGAEGSALAAASASSLSPEAAAAAMLVTPHARGPLQTAAVKPALSDVDEKLAKSVPSRGDGQADDASAPARTCGEAVGDRSTDARTRAADLGASAPSNASGAASTQGAQAGADASGGEARPQEGQARQLGGAGVSQPAGTAATPGAGEVRSAPAAAARTTQGAPPAKPLNGLTAINGAAKLAGGTREGRGVQRSPVAQTLFRAEEEPATAQVTRGLAAALRQRGGSITLRLSPESLGQVRVDLKLDGIGVRAKLETETDEARDVLARDVGKLREALESRGLRVEELVVVSKESGPGSGHGMSAHAGGAGWGDAGSADGGERGSAGGGDGSRGGAEWEHGSATGERTAGDVEPDIAVSWDGDTLRLDAIA